MSIQSFTSSDNISSSIKDWTQDEWWILKEAPLEKGRFLDIIVPMFAKYSHNFSRNLGESVLTRSPSITIECGNLDLFEEFLKSMISLIVDHVFEELLQLLSKF